MRGVYEKVPGSGVWWIRWTDNQGKLHREKAGRRSDAKTLVEKRRTETLQQKKLPEQYRTKVAFDDLCDDAIEHSKATNKPKVTHDLELKVAKLRLVFGDRLAESITRQEIVRWLTQQVADRGWSVATRNRWQAALSLIFRVGIQNSKLEVNPVSLVKQPAEYNGRIRFLSEEEEETLKKVILQRCPKNWPVLALSLNTGLRSSEQFNLRWNDVDLERKLLRLYRKKHSTIQYLPLNAAAIEALKAMKRKNFHVNPSSRKDGEAIRSPKGWFNAALKEAKITDYTWHCNRHTFASRLVMAGVDMRTVGELLGHSVMQMTMRYSHLAPTHKAAAVAKLDGLGKIENGTGTDTSTGSTP